MLVRVCVCTSVCVCHCVHCEYISVQLLQHSSTRQHLPLRDASYICGCGGCVTYRVGVADPGNVLCTGTVLHCEDKLIDQLTSVLEGRGGAGRRGKGKG